MWWYRAYHKKFPMAAPHEQVPYAGELAKTLDRALAPTQAPKGKDRPLNASCCYKAYLP
jgi:hypothetical protein